MRNHNVNKKAVLIKKRRENEVKRHLGDLIKAAPVLSLYRYLTGTRNPVWAPAAESQRDTRRLQRLLTLLIILHPILSMDECCAEKQTPGKSKAFACFFAKRKQSSRKSR